MGGGIHKASEDKGEIHLTIPTWRRAREIAMDLLAVKMGSNNVPITISYIGERLEAIKPKEESKK